MTTATTYHSNDSSQSPDSGIVVVGSGSFSSNDSSSLSPCGNPDAPTSSSDAQAARRRSKSLPEMDSADAEASGSGQERPASAECVGGKEVGKVSPKKSGNCKSNGGALHEGSSGGQRGRLCSTPDMRGTIPLSHAPSAPPLKSSLTNAAFSVPRMNYGSMHAHTGGSYGAMYPSFPSYQSYGMTAAAGMPTQSAYHPPTYNPYSAGGAGSAYITHSGPPGSALYHQNASRPSQHSYSHHQNMLNYMPYSSNLPTDTGRYGTPTQPYTNSALPLPPPLSTANSNAAYPSNTMSADLGHVPLSTATLTTTASDCELGLASISTLASSNAATSINNPELVPHSIKNSTSGSPQNLSSPVIGKRDCDSTTTHLNPEAPASEKDDELSTDGRTHHQEDTGLQYYTTRYV